MNMFSEGKEVKSAGSGNSFEHYEKFYGVTYSETCHID